MNGRWNRGGEVHLHSAPQARGVNGAIIQIILVITRLQAYLSHITGGALVGGGEV